MAEIGDSGTAAIEPGLKVEIDVPLTPSARARVPLSDISESHSLKAIRSGHQSPAPFIMTMITREILSPLLI